MADLSRDELQRLARLGAKTRLDELKQEEAAIRKAFPDLFGARRGGRRARAAAVVAVGAAAARRRKSMSAAQRKAVSDRMKKYWADRRKSKSSK